MNMKKTYYLKGKAKQSVLLTFCFPGATFLLQKIKFISYTMPKFFFKVKRIIGASDLPETELRKKNDFLIWCISHSLFFLVL